MGEQARWNLKVSQQLDTDLRVFLAERGGKKGDLSGFVEKAVARALVQHMTRAMNDANPDLTDNEALALANRELSVVRDERKAFWAARDWNAPYPE